MKNVVELQILGQRIKVSSEFEVDSIREVEKYLNNKVEEVKGKTKAVSTLDLAILTALNVAGEHLKVKKLMGRLERSSEELTKLIDESLA